jgi:hypothetical protein
MPTDTTPTAAPVPNALAALRAARADRERQYAAGYARLVRRVADGEAIAPEVLIPELEGLRRPDLEQFDRDVMAAVRPAG